MKYRTTASVDDQNAQKLAELSQKSGLSQSQILNLCLRYSLIRAPQPAPHDLPYFPIAALPPATAIAPRVDAE
jgi:hypothetical protein